MHSRTAILLSVAVGATVASATRSQYGLSARDESYEFEAENYKRSPEPVMCGGDRPCGSPSNYAGGLSASRMPAAQEEPQLPNPGNAPGTAGPQDIGTEATTQGQNPQSIDEQSQAGLPSQDASQQGPRRKKGGRRHRAKGAAHGALKKGLKRGTQSALQHAVQAMQRRSFSNKGPSYVRADFDAGSPAGRRNSRPIGQSYLISELGESAPKSRSKMFGNDPRPATSNFAYGGPGPQPDKGGVSDATGLSPKAYRRSPEYLEDDVFIGFETRDPEDFAVDDDDDAFAIYARNIWADDVLDEEW